MLGEGATKLQGISPLSDRVDSRCEKADTGFCSQGLSATTSMDEGTVIEIAINLSSCSKTARQRTMALIIMTGETSFASASPPVSPCSYILVLTVNCMLLFLPSIPPGVLPPQVLFLLAFISTGYLLILVINRPLESKAISASRLRFPEHSRGSSENGFSVS